MSDLAREVPALFTRSAHAFRQLCFLRYLL